MNKYFDKIIAVLSSKEDSVDIDVAKEIEEIINDSEDLLEEHGVTISEEEKEELIEALSSDELNDAVNEALTEMKSNMDSDVKAVFDFYVSVTSSSFKIVVIALIAIALVIIALLHKNYYGWLFNLGIASIITGVLLGLALPSLIDAVIAEMSSESDVILSTVAFSRYGYILLAVGVVSIVAKIFIGKNQVKTVKEEVKVAE